jgi:Rhodanese-like domain
MAAMTEKRENLLKKTELLVTLLTITMIGYISVSMLRQHYEPSAEKRFAVLSPGQAIPISGVDWKEAHHTLILAISTDCHFCSESAPFYRRLLQEKGGNGWRAVAVFPQDIAMAKDYVQSKGYPVSEVRQEDFATLGVSATPTLILVDQQGKVQQEWIGRLSASEEKDVAAHLGIAELPECKDCQDDPAAQVAASNKYSPLIETSELSTIISHNDKVKLIDVRPKEQYAHGHLASAINIPLEDLNRLDANKVGTDDTAIVYCHFSAACQYSGIPSLCSNATAMLKQKDIKAIRIIRDPIPLLQEAGLSIVGQADRP